MEEELSDEETEIEDLDDESSCPFCGYFCLHCLGMCEDDFM